MLAILARPAGRWSHPRTIGHENRYPPPWDLAGASSHLRGSPMTQTPTMPAERAHRAAKRYIYAFGAGHAEGDATMRDLLGGKGAGLAEMTNAGLPVPPGFTITTEACNDYFAAGQTLPEGLWDD